MVSSESRNVVSGRSDRRGITLILAVVFVAMLVLNVWTPLIADDFGYVPTAFSTALSEGIAEYHSWSGRFLFNMLNRYLLLAPPLVFDVLNAAVFCAFLMLMALHVAGSWRAVTARKLLIVVLVCWLCLPAFGEAVLWQTGAVTYLWTMTFVLLFLLPYRLAYERLSNKDGAETAHEAGTWRRVGAATGMLLAGAIAGATNETAGLIALALAACAIVWAWRQRHALQAWMLTGLVGAVIGLATVAAAPGNRVRAGLIQETDYSSALGKIQSVTGIFNLSWLADWVLSLSSVAVKLFMVTAHIISTNVFLTIGLIVLVITFAKNYRCMKSHGLAAVLLVVGVGSLPLLYYAGYAGRALFQTGVLLVGFMLIVIFEGLPPGVLRWRKVILTGALTIALVIFGLTAIDSYHFSQFSARRDNVAQEQIAQGQRDLLVPLPPSPFVGLLPWSVSRSEITSDPDWWVNQAYAHYLGVDSVVTEDSFYGVP